MNLPLFMPGMQEIIVVFFALLTGVAIAVYLLRYQFKNAVIRKCLIIFVLAFAGLVIAYILFYAISNAIGRSQVKAKLAEMRERKILLNKDDVYPQEVANTDNGAKFYLAAFNLMDASTSYAALSKMKIEHFNTVSGWPEKEQKTAQQLLAGEDIKLIINLFRQGVGKSYVIYKRNYNGVSTLLPELTSQHELFRLLRDKSFCEGLDGNKETGYRLLCDGFKMIIQFKDEKILISQLTNIDCASINIRSMNELISRYGVTTSSALQLLAELEKVNFNQAMINGFDGDTMIWIDDIFDKIIHGEANRCIDKFGDIVPLNMQNLMSRASWIWPFFYQDYACYLIQIDKIRSLFDKPYWDVQNEMNELSSETSNFSRRYFISNLTFPLLIAFRTKTANIESEIDAAKLMLALHIYKNQNGAFPDKLEQLAPVILKEIPVDPISGKPFEYHKTDGTFELSSVWLKEKRERPKQWFGVL